MLDYFAEDSSRNIVNGSPKDSSSSDYGSIRSPENTRANGPSKTPNSLGYSLSESSNASCQAGFGSPQGFDDWLRFLGPCFYERALRFEESFSLINLLIGLFFHIYKNIYLFVKV